MVYELLSAVGGLGLLAQTVLGFSHGGVGHNASHGGGIHVHGHVHLHSHALQNVHAHGHVHTAASSAGQNASHSPGQQPGHHTTSASDIKPSPLASLFSLLSPLALFTICLGAGVTGLLLQLQVHERLLVALGAVGGGLGLYYFVVRPLWDIIFRFASQPAETLSGAVAKEAEADSRFDAQGRGIVRLPVDGQIVRVLAQLEPEDLHKGIVVTTGDRLVVTQVDRQKNTCRVTRI